MVCLLRTAEGTIAGVSSVSAADVPLVGGRRFWMFRTLLPGTAAAHAPAMIGATFSALAAEFDGAAGAPIGLCVLLTPDALAAHPPEAVWSDPPMVYAGYLADDRQVRIGYFAGASIGQGAAHA